MLPLLMNVKVIPINAPLKYHYEVDYMGFVVDGRGGYKARLAVYKSHMPTMDEGWTRWALEHIPQEIAPLAEAPIWRARSLEFHVGG